MAIRCENGWQSERTLSECMRYMLDNEIATDVCFKVGPPDGATVNIRAHKYMLISRSAVFEAMFSSGISECQTGPEATIRVEDVDAAIFKDLLLYIYCETVSVNIETAASLMYAANKYMLPYVFKECGKCLSEGVNLYNVIHVLQQSLLFNDNELKDKCVELIVNNAEVVFAGSQILLALPQTLETILNIDKLLVKEIVIYETCVAWAKYHLHIQRSTENSTDEMIREILGGLLYQIRFPTMELTEFAEISEGKSILTAEEKVSIYYFLATNKKGSGFIFSTDRRIGEEVWIERVGECIKEASYRPKVAVVDAISFSTDRSILLTGVGLYTGHQGVGYEVDVEILDSNNSLFKKKLTVPATGEANQFKVLVDVPIFIKAGAVYSITTVPHGQIGNYGRTCQPVCKTDTVTFTFSNHPKSWSTNARRGQIPRLYFRF